METGNKPILLIKTVQIAPFRTLMTALKDILIETNITFQKDGMRIVNMDKSHTVLVHLHLLSENFEYYECNKDKIIIGVNVFNLFKLISTVDTEDTLSIYIEDDDYNEGIVENLVLKFENKQKEQCKIQKLKLIEPEQEELAIPDVKFSSIINLPSSDFQKIIRDLNSISDKLEIKSVKSQLIFKCSGSYADVEIIRSESDGMNFVQKNNKVIQGEFSLKNLNYFIKCTNLCNQIQLFMENDLPLIIKYNVASLGEIKLGLAPLPSHG
jgi:proliferating cell nuclear antigen|uniref:Proliferating cell nuclear antigen PCNA N-terminal domain-containing protein n=1 Tax=viral metagenome TaxID=1070528 RepID=A0A6C0HNN0_9ZZZZ